MPCSALPVPVNPGARPTCPVCCDIRGRAPSGHAFVCLAGPIPPIAGDEAPSLALCRREIQSSHPCLSCPVLQPSSPALQSSPAQKGEKLAATAAAVNLAQIHLNSPSWTSPPLASTAPPCWIEIDRVFQLSPNRPDCG
jgi:hypothetical protein